jgi:hypothetical protein
LCFLLLLKLLMLFKLLLLFLQLFISCSLADDAVFPDVKVAVFFLLSKFDFCFQRSF